MVTDCATDGYRDALDLVLFCNIHIGFCQLFVMLLYDLIVVFFFVCTI